MTRRWRLLGGGLVTSTLSAGLLLALSPPGASAQVTATLPSTATIVQAIQEQTVDVYADGGPITPDDGLAAGDTVGPELAPPGTYDLAVVPHTTSPPPTPPPPALIEQTETVDPTPSNFAVVVGVDAAGAPALFRFANDASPLPAGQGRLSIRHTASAPAVDVYATVAGGTDRVLLAAGLANGEGKDVTVPAGTYSVEVFAAGDDPASVTPVIGPLDVTVADNQVVAAYASTPVAGGSTAPTLVTVTQPAPSRVTLVHGIPGPAVDVYLNGNLALAGFEAGTTAGPLILSANVEVTVFAAGADPGSAPPVIAATPVTVPPDADITLIAHLDATGTPTVTAFTNDLSSPGVGHARLAVRHTAAAGPVDVCVDGTVANTTPLANGDEFVAVLPAGPHDVVVVATGAGCGGTPLLGPATVDLAAGNFYEAYAIGSSLVTPGTLDLLLLGPTPTAKEFTPVTPTRIADTRDGTGGVAVARLVPGEVLRVHPGGQGGVPGSGVGAVALNVTAAAPSANGYLSVYPCTATPPGTSNVNYVAGQVAEPNAVVAAVEPITGDVCITAFAETDVVVDITGWFATGSGFTPQNPDRIADTRDATGVPKAVLQPGQVLTVNVTDEPGIVAAALNVTAANTTARGYLTVYPCTPTVPYSSNVNYEPNQEGSPNAVLTALDAEGQVCITTYAPVDVVVDLAGTFTSETSFVGTTPDRVGDTRDGHGGVPVGKLAPGSTLEVPVAGQDGVPATGVSAATLNVTATEADGNGYLTVYPCDGPAPYASNVNYVTTELASPNAVITGLGTDGKVCITSYAPVHVVVDVTGYFAA